MRDATADDLRSRVIAALRTVRDPEIPVNIYDLGLIYDLDISATGAVSIRMTLTAPNCPVAEALPGRVAQAVRTVPGVSDARVELVWEPPWSRERMSDAAKLALGMDDDRRPPQPFVPVDSLARRR